MVCNQPFGLFGLCYEWGSFVCCCLQNLQNELDKEKSMLIRSEAKIEELQQNNNDLVAENVVLSREVRYPG